MVSLSIMSCLSTVFHRCLAERTFTTVINQIMCIYNNRKLYFKVYIFFKFNRDSYEHNFDNYNEHNSDF